MNRRGVITILAALFIGLFALLTGLVGGFVAGVDKTVKEVNAPTEQTDK